jgi:hypothetical protein
VTIGHKVPGNAPLALPAAGQRPRASHAGAQHARGSRAAATRGGAADAVAAAVVVAAPPLCVLQAPDAIGWALGGPSLAAGGQDALLRASGLALPAMAAAAGVAALAARRLRAWPVLLAGLLVLAGADVLGDWARTVPLIGLDRALHGLGAGIVMPAVLALAWERSPRTRTVLAALWAAVTVVGSVAAVAVLRHRVAGGDWHAALQPYPWLTGTALAAAAIYALLAYGPGAPPAPGREGARAGVTHERAQLAVLAVPAAGVAIVSVAASYRPPAALLATAAIGVLVLAGVAAVASADRVVGGPLCLPLVGAVTGLILAPAAGAVTSLRALAPAPGPLGLPLAMAAGGAAAGAAAALAARRRPRAVVLVGLAVAAESLAAARIGGPLAPGPELAGVGAVLCGGLAAAMTAALADATAAGALASVSLMLSGLMTGYVAVGAVQVRMVAGLAPAPPAVRGALTGAVGLWELGGAAALLIAMTGIIIAGRARHGYAGPRQRG